MTASMTRLPERSLTARQARFVAEYLIDGNGAQAAIRAGYAPGSAKVTASRLLTYANVAAALEARRAELIGQLGVTQEQVVSLLTAIASSDIRAFASWGPEGVTLTPSDELSWEQALAVKKVRHTRDGPLVELHDKLSALHMLARILGLFGKDNEQQAPQQEYHFTMILGGGERRETVIEAPARDVTEVDGHTGDGGV